jgi:DNA-binding XRE family transcriptional regulator
MDKRLKKPLPSGEAMERRNQFYADLAAGRLTLADAVVAMRKMSRLTQPEFAKHRGISTQALRQMESGTGNPTLETLNKVVSVYGLEVGLVPKISAKLPPP